MSIDGILVVKELHRLEHGEVAIRVEGHDLVLVRLNGVGEGQVQGHDQVKIGLRIHGEFLLVAERKL